MGLSYATGRSSLRNYCLQSKPELMQYTDNLTFNDTIMENQNTPDKPGYKEDFNKNYLWTVIVCLALALLSFYYAIRSIKAGYGDEYGIDAGVFFIGIAVGTTIYGWYQYRKTFKGEIKRGDRDMGW